MKHVVLLHMVIFPGILKASTRELTAASSCIPFYNFDALRDQLDHHH